MATTTPGQQLDAALLALQLAAQGPAVDFSREPVSDPTPEAPTAPPEIDRTFLSVTAAITLVIEAVYRLADGGPWNGHDLPVPYLRDAVRPFGGHPAGLVAWLLGQSVERVQGVRASMGLDPDTGLPKARPLTSREPVS